MFHSVRSCFEFGKSVFGLESDVQPSLSTSLQGHHASGVKISSRPLTNPPSERTTAKKKLQHPISQTSIPQWGQKSVASVDRTQYLQISFGRTKVCRVNGLLQSGALPSELKRLR